MDGLHCSALPRKRECGDRDVLASSLSRERDVRQPAAFVAAKPMQCVLRSDLSCGSLPVQRFDEFRYRQQTCAIQALEERTEESGAPASVGCLSEQPKQNGPERGRLCVGGGGVRVDAVSACRTLSRFTLVSQPFLRNSRSIPSRLVASSCRCYVGFVVGSNDSSQREQACGWLDVGLRL